MLNPERLLGQLLETGLRGGLGRSRRKKGSKGLLGGMSGSTKAQLGMGLLGIAIAAYEHYTKKGASDAVPSGDPGLGKAPETAPPAPSAPAPSTDSLLLVQAMVAAAASDGVIDDTERAQMMRRADEAGFDADTKRLLQEELDHPKSLAAILKNARPEIAVDLYAASCAAISPDTDAERVYLDSLARHLNLSTEKREEIHRQLGLA